MTNTYDWIIVGGGLTGASVGYELAKQGFSVLLLEQNSVADNATRYSYGGLAYWAGNSALTQQLCREGRERYRQLPEELATDIEFRELDLILTINADCDPQAMAAHYQQCLYPPQLITVAEACELEPQLNPQAIAGALTVKHGHLNPELLVQGYCQAMQRYGGNIQFATVREFLRQGNRILGVVTETETYQAANTLVCAGGWSRQLFQAAGIQTRLYFSHAEILETPPVELPLRTVIMPAIQQRFTLEAQSTMPEVQALWNEPGHEPVPPILDAGAVQFLDGKIRIGQLTRVLTDVKAPVNAVDSEAALRNTIQRVLPNLANLPGTWHRCLVAFSGNHLPLIGEIPELTGVSVFSGFTNPLVLVPPLAQRFAQSVAGGKAAIASEFLP